MHLYHVTVTRYLASNDSRCLHCLQNVIIAGDFNADCSYVTGREWAGVRLRTDPRFEWLLGDDIDSTVGNSNCAYDRSVDVFVQWNNVYLMTPKSRVKPELLFENVTEHIHVDAEHTYASQICPLIVYRR